MAYSGITVDIPCDAGGYNNSQNADTVPKTAMIYPTRNLNLHNGGREKRGGTSHVNSSAVTGTPEINGIFDYTLQSGTQYVVFGTDDGKIWKNATTTIKTGLTADMYPSFAVMDNMLFIANGNNTPETWDGAGASTTTMTDIPSDWSSNKPKQFIKHGRGNSERMWALGFVDGNCYASANGDGDDFSDANVLTFKINTNDGHGIVGGVEFGDRLVVFGKREAFIIDDEDTNTANWGYEKAQWEGGVAHWRLICKTPYDIICMAEDGTIYSVRAAETYGDYKAASLTKASYMDRWIRDNVKLSAINQFHSVYDPNLRAVKIFIVRNGVSAVDTALVFYIDRPLEDAWMIHDNQDYDSGYSAVSSALVRKSTGVWKVYTGDYDGFMWELEIANFTDNSNGYYAGFKTPKINIENPRVEKQFHKLFVNTESEENSDIYVNWWVDGVQQTSDSFSLTATGGMLGTFLLGTDALGGSANATDSISLGQIGKNIQFEIYNQNANEGFFISQVLLDLKPLGAWHE